MVRLHGHAWHHSSHIWYHTLILRGNERRNKWPAVSPGEHRCFFEHQLLSISDIILLTFVSSFWTSLLVFPGPVWSNKTGKAFFRGRDSREERLRLVTMSKENPELLDAGITAFFFFREREKELGKTPLVGFFDFFKVSNVLKKLH